MRIQNLEKRPATDKTTFYLIIGLFLSTLIFLIDLQTPLGIADGVSYVAVVLLTIWIPEKRYVYYAASLGIVLTLIGFLLSPPGESMSVAIPNRVLAIIGIVIAAIIIISYKESQAIVEKTKEQLESLFQHADEGIFILDHQGKIVLSNPKGLSLFDYDTIGVKGKSFGTLVPDFQFSRMNNKDLNDIAELKRTAIAHQRNNKLFPVEYSSSQYNTSEGTFNVVFLKDITIRKKNEEELLKAHSNLELISFELQRANADLEQRVEERTEILNTTLLELKKSKEETERSLLKAQELNELKSRFVTMASHEFRTPLSTILSSIDLIACYAADENLDKRNKHMDRIRGSVHHMTNLLEDFLSLGKIEEGAVTAHPVDFDVHEFCLQICAEMQLLASNKQTIRFSYSGINKQIFQDPKISKNILINLLSNAIKFSGNGKTIYFLVESKLDKIEFIIRDEGIGIPDGDQKHLLKSFFRASNALNINGTGLGLNIVAGYVKMLGGEISFTSKIDVGTTFHLALPTVNKCSFQSLSKSNS